jgi:hypothetical protein
MASANACQNSSAQFKPADFLFDAVAAVVWVAA